MYEAFDECERDGMVSVCPNSSQGALSSLSIPDGS